MSDALSLFRSFGLEEKSAEQAFKSDKARPILIAIIEDAGVASVERTIANLLLSVSTKLTGKSPLTTSHRKHLVQLIVKRRIRLQSQVDAAVKYLNEKNTFDESAFAEAAGVDVVIDEAQIKKEISTTIAANEKELITLRYAISGKLMVQINKTLRWADGKLVKDLWDAEILKLLGPQTEEDKKRPKVAADSGKDEKKVNGAAQSSTSSSSSSSASSSSESSASEEEDKWRDMLNGRDLFEARNSDAVMKAYVSRTDNIIITRFPPEPNGYLHIGHAKAMNFNFGLSKKFGGKTIMRFDDTNPEAEDPIYFKSIKENVEWMGHKYAKITNSSDYFQQLHDFAVQLIKKGKAFVCHQTKEEMSKSKETRCPSPYRNRSVEENLKLFEDMRKGKFAEGAATLRLKGDLNSPNPQMWDIVAYRIKFVPHPQAGVGWVIYPSYDYSHCIVDSLEDISHSLCTLEFEVRREIYYWILHELDIYKPKVWEYSRLNLEYNVLSKRRLIRMVNDKIVRGWDDPRLLTIDGLRRRGYTAESINEFCRRIGVSRNANMIPNAYLEDCIRTELDSSAPRRMVVIKPVQVILTNFPEDKIEECTAPHLPKDSSKGNRKIPLTRVVYIDSDDVRETDSKEYYGLAPGKSVHLKYAYNIRADKLEKNSAGDITKVYATVDFENKENLKGKIHWVAQPKPNTPPLTIEVRLYDSLFKSADPMQLDDWMTDINPNSLTIIENALAEPELASVLPPTLTARQKFQFERVGYFVVDPDSVCQTETEANTAAKTKLVFNRTVHLKESKPFKATPAGTNENTRTKKEKQAK